MTNVLLAKKGEKQPRVVLITTRDRFFNNSGIYKNYQALAVETVVVEEGTGKYLTQVRADHKPYGGKESAFHGGLLSEERDLLIYPNDKSHHNRTKRERSLDIRGTFLPKGAAKEELFEEVNIRALHSDEFVPITARDSLKFYHSGREYEVFAYFYYFIYNPKRHGEAIANNREVKEVRYRTLDEIWAGRMLSPPILPFFLKHKIYNTLAHTKRVAKGLNPRIRGWDLLEAAERIVPGRRTHQYPQIIRSF